MSPWQPIETAPQDGTQILAVGPAWYGGRQPADQHVFICYWWVGNRSNKSRWNQLNGCGESPTHWMPLHKLPTASDNGPLLAS